MSPKSAVDRTPIIDRIASDLFQKDPMAACQYLTDYCQSNALAVIDAWWKLGDALLVKYNHLWIFDAKTRKRRALTFPDWYLKELVNYNKLKPQPEKK